MGDLKAEFFDVPVVLFFFKRPEKTGEIVKRLQEIRPAKLYLVCDGGRDDKEKALVDVCRKYVESLINWDCQIVRNYSDINEGVYKKIGLGALWVFQHEEKAIFLEDDNLPELSFFSFCREMLIRYEADPRVFWVCGTNYLKEFHKKDNSSYVFSNNMFPCGWASWATKFTYYYDGSLSLLDKDGALDVVRVQYLNPALFCQDADNWRRTKWQWENKGRPDSWDHQMTFCIKYHSLLGIVPKFNQINNIGVDENSTHGGTTYSNVMTERFCGLPTKRLEFPLVHPSDVSRDLQFDLAAEKIILFPLRYRVKGWLNKFVKRLLGVDQNVSIRKVLGK